MNSNLAADSDWKKLTGAWRYLPALLIVVAAISYYSSYINYWFNPHDESGTACLIAQRLMQGERPWVDVDTGYNIGWFYPLVAIFKFTGVNLVVARAWFFLLSTITALLGYGIVARVTGSRWLGLAVGLVLIALPGSQFKNYIPLCEAANLACLLALFAVEPGLTRKWLGRLALAGVVLGFTFLLRVEIGFFFTAIWAGVLLLLLLDHRLNFVRRAAAAVVGAMVLAVGWTAAQAPAYLELRSRHLEHHLVDEYASWFSFLRASFRQEFVSAEKPAQLPAPAVTSNATPAGIAPATTTAAPTESPKAVDSRDRSILARKPLSAIWKGPARDGTLAFLTYAPLLIFPLFLALGFGAFVRTVFGGKFTLAAPPLQWLILLGASLTTFPQFFFFRPDRPHLSEFMVGYIISLAACAWLLWPRENSAPRGRRIFAGIVIGFLIVQLGVYATFALQHPSSGTIAARFRGKTWFKGENGVHLRGTKREAAEFQTVLDAVRAHSREGDYVICYPYMPGYNVMTNRRTYLRNVYVDNSTRGENWSERTIREFAEKKPAIVIIDDRAINSVDSSRFSRWAAQVYEHLQKNYQPVGKFETIEIFARPAAAP